MTGIWPGGLEHPMRGGKISIVVDDRELFVVDRRQGQGHGKGMLRPLPRGSATASVGCRSLFYSAKGGCNSTTTDSTMSQNGNGVDDVNLDVDVDGFDVLALRPFDLINYLLFRPSIYP